LYTVRIDNTFVFTGVSNQLRQNRKIMFVVAHFIKKVYSALEESTSLLSITSFVT
jgi:hypothetical protein